MSSSICNILCRWQHKLTRTSVQKAVGKMGGHCPFTLCRCVGGWQCCTSCLSTSALWCLHCPHTGSQLLTLYPSDVILTQFVCCYVKSVVQCVCVCVYVCVCLCVCVERERQRERVCVCVQSGSLICKIELLRILLFYLYIVVCTLSSHTDIT